MQSITSRAYMVVGYEITCIVTRKEGLPAALWSPDACLVCEVLQAPEIWADLCTLNNWSAHRAKYGHHLLKEHI